LERVWLLRRATLLVAIFVRAEDQRAAAGHRLDGVEVGPQILRCHGPEVDLDRRRAGLEVDADVDHVLGRIGARPDLDASIDGERAGQVETSELPGLAIKAHPHTAPALVVRRRQPVFDEVPTVFFTELAALREVELGDVVEDGTPGHQHRGLLRNHDRLGGLGRRRRDDRHSLQLDRLGLALGGGGRARGRHLGGCLLRGDGLGRLRFCRLLRRLGRCDADAGELCAQ
jgi:hypothetical protein